ncbi:MAG: transposase family protein [Sterolibacteriaceae bacterium]|uniref:Transposase family protein n=1 Tax=Candidatus Methylophosphatis roskildensis TaxID=2899263 RepID=A0A9D7E7U5_9PROT|nr:transposase family protein [Candidatus Methylophosphatis roskildensis]MBK6974472.1 transposase family protein [Candidatus Methylophosphatis roskildensis]MBK6975574.1 transposase family protein [Candidatus Methylophosphatis roskildensis]MBK7236235.1 transposase family protein [Sterolibacteriaceae bacterium]
MGKVSRRPAREAAKQALQKKHQYRELRQQQQAAGLIVPAPPSPASRLSPYQSVEEECHARTEAVTEQARVFRAQLPTLLKRLRQIQDTRNPKKLKHALVSLMLYGILVFVLHYSSRREANTDITRPMFEHNLRLLFPELDSLPHADTLFRLLSKIDVGQIEHAHIDLVERLIRKKKFANYRINNCYPIAIDGTQKVGGATLWSESLQEKRLSGSDQDAPEHARYQYHVYVLEANLCFHNGMVIPLMSEFLDYQHGDTEQNKQDCELRAFHRLAERIKKAFPRLAVMLLLDGLYPNGPVLERCRDYHWQFMIVLKDDSLPTVWTEYGALLKFKPDNEHRQSWGERAQHFRWVNDIRYEYGPNHRHHRDVHVVLCRENWQALDEDGEIVTKTAKHAWISSQKLRRENVHQRCNLAARHRWGSRAATWSKSTTVTATSISSPRIGTRCAAIIT